MLGLLSPHYFANGYASLAEPRIFLKNKLFCKFVVFHIDLCCIHNHMKVEGFVIIHPCTHCTQ